jgi:hypothetical protein
MRKRRSTSAKIATETRDVQGDIEAGDISPPTSKGSNGVVFDDDMEMIKSAEEARSAAELRRVTMEQSRPDLDEKRLEVEKKRSEDEREERECRRDLDHRGLTIEEKRLDFDEKRMQMEVKERSALVSLMVSLAKKISNKIRELIVSSDY